MRVYVVFKVKRFFNNLLVTSGVITRSDAVGGQTGVEVRTADAIFDSCLGLGIPADVMWIYAGIHTSRIWVKYASKCSVTSKKFLLT